MGASAVMNKIYTGLFIALLLSACTATHYRPVVDPKVCEFCNYNQDLAHCRQLGQDNTNLAANAGVGAALGAGVFAVTGALLGVDAGSMAGLGAALGGAQGLGGEARASRDMVARCMVGRGYSVLR